MKKSIHMNDHFIFIQHIKHANQIDSCYQKNSNGIQQPNVGIKICHKTLSFKYRSIHF